MDKKSGNAIEFNKEVKRLNSNGPERLYLLYGVESYLMDRFVESVREKCIGDDASGFSAKKFNGPSYDLSDLKNAIDLMPFLSDRTFIELNSADLSKMSPAEEYEEIFSSIPEYCTIVIRTADGSEPDTRLKISKWLSTNARELNFTNQSGPLLDKWIDSRFKALGKTIGINAKHKLVMSCGELMNNLIPEIEKIAAYARDPEVTCDDVEAAAVPLPESRLFEMVDKIASKKPADALSILNSLLEDKNNDPIAIIALLGSQYARLLAADTALRSKAGIQYVKTVCSIGYDYIAEKQMTAAKKLGTSEIKKAIDICIEADRKMKSNSDSSNSVVLYDAVVRIIANG